MERESDMRIKTGMALGAVCCSGATADFVEMVGGQTSVLLDFQLIEDATGLQFAGVSEGVITPGNLGEGSVAFGITSPFAASEPTTFGYAPTDFFGTFQGSIEHRGAVYFGGAADLTVGNFSIGWDDAKGFQVVDTIDLDIALFDVNILAASPLAGTFDLDADLLISNTFADLLIDLGLTETDLSGTDVGDARVQGINRVIPSPAAAGALLIAGLFTGRRRRN